jgi:hypothetical protein
MLSIAWGRASRYQQMAQSVDKIGWRQFMEGMVPKEMRGIQEMFEAVEGTTISMTNWATGVIIKLLEVVHGQWLYRCIQIHNKTRGTLVTPKKEELQKEIEEQMEQEWSDLLEEDQYLAEVNLEDLEQSSRERQRYWLLSICAALEASGLRGGPANQRSRNGHNMQDGRPCSLG